ncbi:sigma 54-interacting transcriptional regulator [Bacterioplanoides sp.]|uniref:sigma 54-interacting transcriptional regulator n=1 Tax=Bacterioplanoides sp. TaxID=2066072 RepID=UPI003B00C15D
MEECGSVIIYGHQTSPEFPNFCRTINSLGFEFHISDLKQFERCKGNAKNIIEILHLIEPDINNYPFKLMRQSGPFNLLVTTAERLRVQPELTHVAAEVSLASAGLDEIALRLHRSMAFVCANEEKADCAVEGMVGNSEVFCRTLNIAQRYAQTDATVLIQGETGTGKELAAKAIHQHSKRNTGPFNALNCGALPDHLIENELFGHARGAYTDARSPQAGLLKDTHGGTLFLDEVDAFSLKAQATLLRFLQDGSFRALGSGKEEWADVRIIAASNQNLHALADQKKFRPDLLYRLNTLNLHMPSLRQRMDDIPLLTRYFLSQCHHKYRLGEKVIHPLMMEEMQHQPWHGNVRELENYVQRIYLLSDQPVISCEPQVGNHNAVIVDPAKTHNEFEFSAFADAKKAVIDQFEADYLSNLLQHTRGNVSQAARIAGKERRDLGRLLKKHNIDRASYISI